MRITANVLLYTFAVVVQVVLFTYWVAGAALHPVAAVFGEWACPRVYDVPHFGLWRKCGMCKATLMDDSEPEALPKCGECGYDLTGNTSGTCPECGWSIPHLTRTLLLYDTRLRFTQPVRRKLPHWTGTGPVPAAKART